MAKAAYTKKQLAKLKAAYATGVLRVRINDTEMHYQSSADMLKAIRVIENELRIKERDYSIVPKFDKGL